MPDKVGEAYDKIINNGRDIEQKFASPRWDISQERAFIENLLGQRFNFFMAFFSLVIGGAISTREIIVFQIPILWVGLLICTLIMLTLFRTQKKLNIILSIIERDASHPVTVTTSLAGGWSVRRIVGYYIPAICVTLLLVASLTVTFGNFPSSTASTVVTGCNSMLLEPSD
ncbi:MAG: hypothetical protein K5Q68_18045 [Roseococcus sp.]|nr:hypothetical protein [Roseococcus sp.]